MKNKQGMKCNDEREKGKRFLFLCMYVFIFLFIVSLAGTLRFSLSIPDSVVTEVMASPPEAFEASNEARPPTLD